MKEKKEILSVAVDSYAASYRLLDGGKLLFMRREVKPPETIVQQDVFGRAWALSKGELRPGQLRVRHGEKDVDIVGRVCVFIPPFSIIEWLISPLPFTFDTIYCTSELPPALREKALLFSVSDLDLPRGLEEALSIVSGAAPSLEIQREEKPSSLGRRARQRIIDTYSQEVSIAEIAEGLGVLHPALTRTFKKDYGLSPVVYRNKLRIFDALRLMQMEHYLVADASFAVGFEDLSRFNRQFHKELKQAPSKFRF